MQDGPPLVPASALKSYIFGHSVPDLEKTLMQYAATRLSMSGFTERLMRSFSGRRTNIGFVLPPAWRATLLDHDVPLSNLKSRLLWQGYIFVIWAYGIREILKLLLRVPRRATGLPSRSGFRTHFLSLDETNLPRLKGGIPTVDLLTWYIRWSGRPSNLCHVSHTVNGVNSTDVDGTVISNNLDMFSECTNWRQYFSFLLWAIFAGTFSLFDIFRGRWWHAFMLSEAAKRKYVELQPLCKMADEYWFNSSGPRYRPLWTYDCEKRGADSILYFYSTNVQGFKHPSGYKRRPLGWNLMTWSRYIVWDSHQASFLRAQGPSPAKIDVVGVVWFVDAPVQLPKLSNAVVSVFDVTPVRRSFYMKLGQDLDVYVPEFCTAFLQDVIYASRRADLTIALKAKRQIGGNSHPKYRSFVNSLDTKGPSLQILDPSISAWRIIKLSKLVVSAPFTSTALIGRELGVPSCYYDPLGVIQQNDEGAHGIEIIHGADRLLDWMLRHRSR